MRTEFSYYLVLLVRRCVRRNFSLSGSQSPMRVRSLESFAIYTASQNPCALPTSFAHFHGVLKLRVFLINLISSSNRSCIVELQFFFKPMRFFFCCEMFNIFEQASGHIQGVSSDIDDGLFFARHPDHFPGWTASSETACLSKDFPIVFRQRF